MSKVFVVLIVVLVFCAANGMFIAGGLSRTQPATPEIQQLIEEFKDDILQKTGSNSFPEFRAIAFRQQVVAGVNYFVKVKVGTETYIHVRLYVVPWEQIKGVTGVQTNKSLEDRIEYF